ncbi:hypothetical protein O181_103209 [Austropuccinia psidii MF-1]|uniref:Integrase catalytic domain-containing protein n=1 Tax=Austropuccinia psidii MF-1 TaxID=1389203 RepID=A0A9Q3PJ01_9BASI|nr:hypothetical protein [Austropuccinia psidii MF-1]
MTLCIRLLINLHRFFGTKLSFSTAYHPQKDGLAERLIQTSAEMIRRFCAYGLEFKDSDGFTHDWCTLIPALELAYKTSVHSSTGQARAMLEKAWNPRLPEDTVRCGYETLIKNQVLFLSSNFV